MNIFLINSEERKEGKRTRKKETIKKQRGWIEPKSKVIDLAPIISIITLDINWQDTPVERDHTGFKKNQDSTMLFQEMHFMIFYYFKKF